MSKPQAASKKSHKLFKLSLLAVSVNCAFVQANDEYSKEKYVELGKILLGGKYLAGFNTDNKGVNTPFGLDPVYTPDGSYIGDKKYHTGIDYQAGNKTAVYSPVDGTVFELPSSANVGMLAVQMDDGKCFNLLHLNSSVVGKNTKVKKGQQIAFSGDVGTRDSKGLHPHLHIELRNGSCLNKPFPWIYSAENLSQVGALNPLSLLSASCPIPVELAVVTTDPFLTSLYGVTKPNGTRIVSTSSNAIHQDSRLELVVMLTRLLEAKKKIDNLGTGNVESLDKYLKDTKNVTPDEALVLRKAVNMNLIDSGDGVSFRPTCRAKQNEAYILFDRAYNWLYAGNTRPTTTPKHTLPVEFNALKDNTSNITRATSAKYLMALYNSFAPAKQQDTYPNPFSFNAISNVSPNTLVTSDAITISGIDASTKLSVQNGQYAIGCSADFKNFDTWVINSQKICVRHTSSSQANTPTKTTLTIGNQSADFTSTTKANLNSAPIVDGTSIPSTLTVDNGKSGFVLKTTEAVASVQLKINGVNYNLVPDGSRKSWTFNATNLAQQGQVNYELAVLKTGALTPIKQTGTFTLKSSIVTPPNVGKAGEFAAYLDPQKLGEKWQTGKDALIDKTLAAGYLKMTPAELIYYSSIKENKINPILLLAKLQHEQQLIEKNMDSKCHSQSRDEFCLPYRLPKAVGFNRPNSGGGMQYEGFFPQLVAAAFQFKKYNDDEQRSFENAAKQYTQQVVYKDGTKSPDTYPDLLRIYQQYAQKMNVIAGKNYQTKPDDKVVNSGYIKDFQDITIANIQTFLQAYGGRLKEKNLFYTTAGNGGGVVNPPPVNQAPTVSGIATANADGSISISVKATDPENQTVGVDAYLWSEQQSKFTNVPKKNIERVASGSTNTLIWSSNDLKAWGITSGGYKIALDVFDASALQGKRIYSNVVTIAQPIVDASATVPKELTVNNGKASFVLKTTEAVSSIQLKINGVAYNLTSDGSRKSWTFNATNLAQQGQVNYELAVYKNSTATPIKQTGTITLKSSVVIQPMQQWQTASLAYANKYHGLYANTPMTNVAGNVCGTYTFCYAFSRNADGIKIPAGFGNAFTAFGNLKNSAKYGQFTHATSNFAVIPLGAVVFFKGGSFGHAAIKVSATEMISQGQPNCRITKVRFDSMKSLALVGYYAPSDGVTGLDDPNNANLIAPELRVGRGFFAQSISGALRSFDKTLPSKDADLIAIVKLFSSNPLADTTPIIRQDVARVLDRAVVYFESKGFKFKRVTDTRFNSDTSIPADMQTIVRRLAELGIFKGVQQEDGSFKFYGSQQLSQEEMQIVIGRLNTALQSAEKPQEPTNKAPVVNYGTASVGADGSISVTFQAADPENQTIGVAAYVMGTNGNGVTKKELSSYASGSTKTIVWSASELKSWGITNGTYQVAIDVFDSKVLKGSRFTSNSVTVKPQEPTNKAPVVNYGTASVGADGSISVTFQAADPENQTIGVAAYVMGTNGNGVTKKELSSYASGSTKTIVWSASELKSWGITNGTYQVAIDVFDSKVLKGSRFTSNSVTVKPQEPTNKAPVVNYGTASVGADGSISVTFQAADPENQTIGVAAYVMGTNGNGVTKKELSSYASGSTKTIVWSASELKSWGITNGTYQVAIDVFDSKVLKGSRFTSNSVTVKPQEPTNKAPVVNYGTASVGADGSISVTFQAADPENQTIGVAAYVMGTNGNGVTKKELSSYASGSTKTIVWSASELKSWGITNGTYQVAIDVFDSKVLKGSRFTSNSVTVKPQEPTNKAPVVNYGTASVGADGSISVTFQAADPENQTIGVAAYVMGTNGNGVTKKELSSYASGSTKTIVWSASELKSWGITNGTYQVAIDVFDSKVLKGSRFTSNSVTVKPQEPTNKAPVVNYGTASVGADGSISVTFQAADPENQTIGVAAYVMGTNGNGVTKKELSSYASGSTKTIVWSASELKSWGITNGTYQVAIDVFDSKSLKGDRFTSNSVSMVTIAPPQIVDFNHTPASPSQIKVGQNMTFFVQVNNPETVNRVTINFYDINGNFLASEDMFQQGNGYWGKTRTMSVSGFKRYDIRLNTTKGVILSSQKTFRVVN